MMPESPSGSAPNEDLSVMSEEPAGSTVSLHSPVCAMELTAGALLSVTSLRWRGRELLVDPLALPEHYRVHNQRAGITLLHPWANRLGADDYTIAGASARVRERDGPPGRLTRDANGLVIHGVLPSAPWQLRREGPDRALASLGWPGDPAFPFPHRMDVAVHLSDTAAGGLRLDVATTLTATGPGPVPVSFGWHPYFHRDPTAVLERPGLGELEADPRGLPTGTVLVQPAATVRLADANLDLGVSDLPAGSAMVLHNDAEEIGMHWVAGYPDGQIFAPADAAVLSLEPMTAWTDALCRGTCALAHPEHPYRAAFAVTVDAA